MKIIVCVDDNGGTMFNHRRQSQDRVLREEVFQMMDGKDLWMNSYSKKMFGPYPGVKVAEDFLSRASKGDFCFVEGIPISEYAETIEEIVLFKWNRVYPADTYFAFPTNCEYKLVQTSEFAGSSHEKITKEVYAR